MGKRKETIKRAKNKSITWLHVKRDLILFYISLIVLIVFFFYSIIYKDRGLIVISVSLFFILIIVTIIMSLHPRAFEVKGLGFLFRGFYGEPETTFKGVYGDKEMEGITKKHGIRECAICHKSIEEAEIVAVTRKNGRYIAICSQCFGVLEHTLDTRGEQ